MKPGQKLRIKRILLPGAGAAGLVGLTIHRGIPCLFYRLTGLRCPACGMTRAAAALARGQWRQALAYNLFCIPILALGIWLLGMQIVRYIRQGRCGLRPWERRSLAMAAGLLLVWAGARNLWHI